MNDPDIKLVLDEFNKLSFEEAMELGIKLANPSLVRLIFPTDIKKYIGYIQQVCNKFRITIKTKHLYDAIHSTFTTYEEAFNFIKSKNISLKLPISNIIQEYNDYLKVELTSGKFMICDKEDIELIQKYTWYVEKSGNICYATTWVNERNLMFHNLLLNHTPGEITVDHINRNSLDNRKINLRLANRFEQVQNRGIPRTNTSGVKSVHIRSDRYTTFWEAKWFEHGKAKSKVFSIRKYGNDQAKQLAIDWKNSHPNIQ